MITDILIEPVAEKFDAAKVNAFLDAMPHVAKDPVAGHTYLMASDARQLRDALAARVAKPTSFPMTVILVDVGESRIDVSFRIPWVEPARHFVEWLQKEYALRIMDDAFHDYTTQCKENLDFLFGPRPRP